MQTHNQLLIVEPAGGASLDLGGMAAHLKVLGDQTRGGLSVMEHPMDPGRMIPPHLHRRQDELSYVLEGTFGMRVGDEVGVAGPGSYFLKPRGVPHTFWNPGPAPARLIEIMWPGGYERFLEGVVELARTVTDPAQLQARLGELAGRHDVEMVPEWIPQLKERYGLRVIGEP